MQWDREVDVVVVGSGLGAMTSALCLKEMGVDKVEVIEKAGKWGGTSGVSGGGVWVPNNHYAKACGATDSVADAKAYLGSTISADKVPEALIDCYIENSPKMMEFVSRTNEVGYISLEHYPDYYMQSPGAKSGHRSLEPQPINWDELGEDMGTMQETHHMMYLFDRIGFTQVEGHDLVTRAPGWWKIMVRLMFKYVGETFWRMKHKTKRARRLACGAAGTARMFLALKNRNIPVTLNTAMTELVQDENGKVIGIKARQNGKEISIKANKGVVLGSGGYEYNQELREKYLPQPTNKEWSGGNIRTNTGDSLIACQKIGAKTRLLEGGAWWCTTIKAPDEPAPRLAIMEKSLPGSCVVNMAGKRIANESQNYMAYQTEFFESHSEDSPNYPAYMVFDKRFRDSYMVGPLLDVQSRPDKALPAEYFENGFMAKEDTIDALADKLGIDKAGLNETIKNLNEYAKTGKDLEFNRGDTAYDRYYGDETVTPNPCLHAIDQAPFYAVRIDPGDFGTNGGMDTNVNAQVLAESGEPIEGLYAVGNCAAAILPTYPGPGSTLGPAMTWGYQAAKHISGYKD